MRSCLVIGMASISLALLSGCAFVAGQKNDQTSSENPAVKSAAQSPQPVSYPQVGGQNATENAAKAMSPLTGY